MTGNADPRAPLGGLITPEIPSIDAYEPALVLDGLRILYERNREAED
jgi:hypothetical protein